MSKVHIYFIQCSKTGAVKIGKANNVANRLSTLQTSNPYKLNLIAVVEDCEIQVEKHFHNSLKKFRLNGEWFSPKILKPIHRLQTVLNEYPEANYCHEIRMVFKDHKESLYQRSKAGLTLDEYYKTLDLYRQQLELLKKQLQVKDDEVKRLKELFKSNPIKNIDPWAVYTSKDFMEMAKKKAIDLLNY
jgi:hypothetical protein